MGGILLLLSVYPLMQKMDEVDMCYGELHSLNKDATGKNNKRLDKN